MKNGLVIADSGPIFSLALIDKLDILNILFDDIKISNGVWNEITYDIKCIGSLGILSIGKD